ncbi:MAG: tRNA (N(6)-L-threonylcarbamoyladenosine(37)-C(2))-methylthiotransferase MtaB [Bacteroidales bacterium]|nr:tRNA (N(6)-L-threonylcarbamoyladenosine(37)-C(2))-methylthiotransferase MtaB [Bacteroidales bacterium]
MRIATHTLGCKLNFAETSHITRQFVQAGHEVVDFRQKADLYVVNTCTVTAVAEKKCRNAIRQAAKNNPDAIVAVIGCFAQNAAAEVEKIPGVTLVLGNSHKHKLFHIVQEMQKTQPACERHVDDVPSEFALAYSSGDRTRTFFKIQDGCDYFCTYCAIPFARGRSRCATIKETVAMANEIAQTGAKEVVLTGVNTGTFGLHTGESFMDLVKELDRVEGIERYRISSIEPNLLTDEIIDFVASSHKFAHHFHIPLQAGSDKVLQLMRRRYDTAFYAEKLRRIKETMPEACLAADLMVGFYGETSEEFAKACDFIESLPISYLHVFTYSERPNTAALKMEGKVPVQERHKRNAIMQEISERKKHQFYMENLGRTEKVLWESNETNGEMHGFTGNYIRLHTSYDSSRVNTLEALVLSQENVVEETPE